MNDDLDERYRAASAREAGEPAESTRRTILETAAALAAQRAATATAASRRDSRTGTSRTRWRRPALLGTLAAASLAGLVVVPQFLRPDPPSVPPPRSAALPSTAPPTAAPAPAPAVDAVLAAGPTRAQSRPAMAAPTLAEAGAARSQATSPAPSAAPAALAPSTPWVSSLRAQAADINGRDAAGLTPLLNAVLRGDEAAVTALLKQGADPNIAAPDGTTPLRAALDGDRAAIADLLRGAGAH